MVGGQLFNNFRSLNINQICNLIISIEERFKVDQWAYKGIDLWPIIRIKYFHLLIYHFNNLSLPKENKRKEATSAPLKLYETIVSNSQNNLTFKQKNIDIVVLADNSYLKVEKKSFHKLVDPILLQLNQYNLKYQTLLPYDQSFAPFFSNTKMIWHQLFFKRLIAKIKNKFTAINALNLSDKKEIDAYLLNNSLPKLPSQYSIFKEALKIHQYASYFEKYLKKNSAKLGLVISYYNPQGFAYNRACRKLNIPVMDIQHGVQGKTHLAYSRWTKLSKQSYNTLPTHFWCWTNHEPKEIEKWAGKNTCTEGGHPFIEFFNSTNKYFQKEKKNFINLINSNLPTLLVTLQTDLLEKEYEPLFSVINKTYNTFNWVLRLHPVVLKSKKRLDRTKKMFDFFGTSFKNVLTFSKLPLPIILAKTDLHITVNSSVVIEAAQYNIESILLQEDGLVYYEDQIPKRFLNLALSEEAIRKTIIQKLFISKLKKEGIQQRNSSMNTGINFIKKLLN